MKVFSFGILIAFSVGCTHPSTKSPTVDGQRAPAVEAAESAYPRCVNSPRLNEECIQPGEKEKFEHQASQVTEAMRTIASKKRTSPRRGFHAKSHGCLKGELVIDPANLGKDYGIFSYRDNKLNVYPTWVRFSNGMPMNFPDAVPDFRGMAIKVMNIEVDQEGRMAQHLSQEADADKNSKPILKNQDFIMINSPTPILKTSEDAVELMKALAGLPEGKSFNLIRFMKDHIEVAPAAVKQVRLFVSSLPRETYYSGAPLRLGDNHAVKLKATPCKQNAPTVIGPALKERLAILSQARNPLKADLALKAADRELCFSIEAQFQKNPQTEPLEDASVIWDSPYHHIGHLRFEVQTMTEAKDQFCQKMAFSPWNGIPEHRPLGEVMRARQAIYSASQDLRQAAKEPTGNEQY